MGQEWDEDPETMINQSAPTAAQDPEEDSSGAVADDDDGSFSPELFDEDEVRLILLNRLSTFPSGV